MNVLSLRKEKFRRKIKGLHDKALLISLLSFGLFLSLGFYSFANKDRSTAQTFIFVSGLSYVALFSLLRFKDKD